MIRKVILMSTLANAVNPDIFELNIIVSFEKSRLKHHDKFIDRHISLNVECHIVLGVTGGVEAIRLRRIMHPLCKKCAVKICIF